MNKKFKIASAAVAVVMAGTMAFGMFGCNSGDDNSSVTPPPGPGPSADVKVDEAGKLTWDADTVIATAIGYNDILTGMKLKAENTGMVGKSFMGKTWSQGSLKPAWQKIEDDLDVSFDDVWAYTKEGGQSSSNLETVKTANWNADVFTTQLVKANEEAVKNDTLLNLADYLDYMPNYKKFLESDVIRMSLMASSDGDMYIAPYFDGNNDIEKFVLLRKDIVVKMLDGTLPTTGDGTFNKATAITAYMGSTNYTVKTTAPASLKKSGEGVTVPRYGTDAVYAENNNTVDVTVNYTAALEAAKGSGALHDALLAANTSLNTSTLTSGNIVDLMNAAIGSQTTVTGTQLINILRAYIDVAYTVGGQPLYTQTNGLSRSGVFNSACAAWDVDLYAALGRCYVASGTMFESGSNKVLISGRTNDDQRQSDMYSLVGELYGIRGLESRYGYSYVDKDGNLKDTRANADTWEAMNAFSAFSKEGLVNWSTAGGNYDSSKYEYKTLSLHDYVQTQTAADGFKIDSSAEKVNMAPVVTPVSKWDVDGDGNHTDIMRFTESWRSVKTDGIAVKKAVKNDPNKLSAVLAFIDYIYSSDGQIAMTYGPRSTTGNTSPNGTWYATEATDVTLAQVATKTVDATNYLDAQYEVKDEYKKDYFVYDGRVYSGTFYNGRNIPTMTDENLALFAATSNNFTNHARRNLGTCFPVGNKDQGFEYQCTAACGLDGSDIVNICLNNGTIKHQFQTVDKSNLWYMLVPTALPYESDTTAALGAGNLQFVSGLGNNSNTLYCKASGQHNNFFLKLMENGFATSITINEKTIATNNAAAIISSHNSEVALNTFVTLSQEAFGVLMDWYDAQ